MINDPLKSSILLVVLIILTVLSYFFLIYFRGKRATHFGNLSTLIKVHGFKRFQVSPWILVTKIVIVTLLFLVATESITISKDNPVTDTDYVIVLDSSSSMANTDFEPNRLTAAKDVATDWLKIIPNSTRIGFIAFSQSVSKEVPLTFEEKNLIRSIKEVKINYSQSGTSLDYALRRGMDLLRDTKRNKAILLLTDGTEDVKNTTLAYAVMNNIKIFSFGIGGNNSQQEIVVDEDIPEDLRNLYNQLDFNFTKLEILSNRTSGTAYRISDETGFREALRSATMEEIQVELNSSYYIILLISLLSIAELMIYAKLGGL